MNTASFSIKEAIGFGWAMTKEKFWFLMAVLAVSAFFAIIPDVVDTFTNNRPILFLAQVASFVLGFVIDAGLVYILLRLHDGKEVKVSDVFSQYPITFRYFVASVIYALMILLGLLFLIIPGIYIALRYQFFNYSLIDKQGDIVSSFKRSAEITEGHKWHLFRFVLALIGVNLLGLLALGVGIFVTIPLSMLAVVYVYRKLSSPIKEGADEENIIAAFAEELEEKAIATE